MKSMNTTRKKPIKLWSVGGYVPFCSAWWNDIGWWAVGVSLRNTYDDRPWWRRVDVDIPGWVKDIRTYWHRARYGWAPRDTWSLDYYLCGVLAGSLERLADHAPGTPAFYPNQNPVTGDEETDHNLWRADLKRWAKAFSESPHDVDIYDAPTYEKQLAEEERRRDAIHTALRQMEPWFDALWD